MKKAVLLFLLLLTSITYGQTTLANKLKITGNSTSLSASKVNVQESDGQVNTISKSDLIDVLEYASAINLPTTGVSGKIYVTIDNKKMYRWNGTIYQELALTNISGKEDVSNKQNSLAIDGTGTKYPTVDAVNAIDLQKVIGNGARADVYNGLGYNYISLDDESAYMGSLSSDETHSSGVNLEDGFLILHSQYVTGRTNVVIDTPISETNLNFPAKTIPGTYTLATTDEISTLDSNVVHKTGIETITGSKTFQTDTSSPSITILNNGSTTHPAQKIYNTGSGNGLEIDFTTGTGDAIAVFNNGNKTLSLSREGNISSNSNYIKSSLKLLNSDADLYGDISLNLDRYLFNNKSGNLQFLTQNSGFVTYKSPTISGTFSNGNLTESRTFTLPDATGTIPIVSQTITNGVTNKSPSEDAVYDALALKVSGSGTTNYLPKFTASGTVGNSLIYDNGTGIGINTDNPLSALQVNTSGQGFIRIGGSDGRTIESFSNAGVPSNTTVANLSTTTIYSTNIIDKTSNQLAVNFGANFIALKTANTEKVRLAVSGALLLNTTADDGIATNKLQVNGNVKATQFRISALNTAPASATDTGTLGEVRITATYIYVCTATNTWVRTALTTW